jgi:hypothetical protein
MTDKPKTESEWLKAMAELEEQRGSIVPGGAQGGLAARARREAEAACSPGRKNSASARSRARVRKSFRSRKAPTTQAA